MSNMPTTVAPFVPQSSGATEVTGVNVGDGSNGADNTKLSKSTIIGIASAGVSLIVIIILLWWSLARRKKRRGQTSRSEKHVNPFLTPSEMTHRSSRSLIRDDIMMERRSNHPRGSPEPSPVIIDEAEQLRQWMASPITEILPPYQTEMGSAYVVRENTEEDDTTDTYSPGFTVQNHDNVGGESTGDILRHQGRALRDLKR
ncbi:hypothetical protein CPB86DRAFT_626880 [Serendipita vermifera]|nr:hypothetical protein CPB86DRAFT_626880 [Serendipita vermifera]